MNEYSVFKIKGLVLLDWVEQKCEDVGEISR